MKKFALLVLSIFILINSNAQGLTQTVKGQVVDNITKYPLIGATIVVVGISPILGASTDIEGNFRIDNVPIGRHQFQISFVGFEPLMLPDILVGSGKTVNLNIELIESLSQLDEIVITPDLDKERPLNEMALVSARSFSVEETRRFAGGIDDPARMASSFAGVASGEMDDNGIVIRGNAPKGILWRLEGIEIPNPNHFSGASSIGGGGVSALSALMLTNSDFFTGAFPAEYGNASSGVFDLKMRNGNNDKYEHTFQAGLLGIDFSSEGPFKKGKTASYLFNYRYSTFALILPFLPEDTNVPKYQDLSFKINIPTKDAGTFSVWALGFLDKISDMPDEDTTTWEYIWDRQEDNLNINTGILGLSHKYHLSKKTFLESTMAVSINESSSDFYIHNPGGGKYLNESSSFTNTRLSLASSITKKRNARYSNKTGFYAHLIGYDTYAADNDYSPGPIETLFDERGTSSLIQAYSQSQWIFDRMQVNAGLHSQYFDYTNNLVIEPRLGMAFDMSDRSRLSLGYGLHSRLELLSFYMAKQNINNRDVLVNKDLELSKAHHLVLGYDFSINDWSRLKIEPYFQYLYDVPVIRDSSYSLVNLEWDFYVNDDLINKGTAHNIGVDITLERFLKDNFYYLITASIFDSKYVGGDNIERNTMFNRNFVLNVLGGKEWTVGASGKNLLGLNVRFQYMGGNYESPIDRAKTFEDKFIRLDATRAFSQKEPFSYHTYITATYTKNKEKTSRIWALQLFNFPTTPEYDGKTFNEKKNKIEKDKYFVVFPLLSYKIEF